MIDVFLPFSAKKFLLHGRFIKLIKYRTINNWNICYFFIGIL